MSHTSTLTLLGQANQSETKTSASAPVAAVADEQSFSSSLGPVVSSTPDNIMSTKSQLNLFIASTTPTTINGDGLRNGLRIRGSGAIVKVAKYEESQVLITDENNNLKKTDSPATEDADTLTTSHNTTTTDDSSSSEGEGKETETSASDKSSASNRMWGFFRVDQPVKLLNSILIPIYHVLAIYALANITFDTKLSTIAWGFFIGGMAGFGVTGGVHRMWTHKAYKAKLPLRIILAICFSVSGQNTIYDWVRDHRVHHKYSETNADPHDSNRGFWFAHVGWLMMNKHPNVVKKGRQIDMSDILEDPVVQFHQKHFLLLKLLFCFILPSIVPALLLNETWYNSIMSQAVIRYVLSLNFTWLVNSAAHIWGNRPYDKRINPSENILVSFFAMGEGWHNYHHVFPWDYKAAELPYKVNFTTLLIDMFAKIGWAYDLKEPSKDLVRRTIDRHGDGTHASFRDDHHHHMPEVEYAEDLH